MLKTQNVLRTTNPEVLLKLSFPKGKNHLIEKIRFEISGAEIFLKIIPVKQQFDLYRVFLVFTRY